MDILNPRSLREDAKRALARGRDPKKLIFTYAGIVLGLSLALAAANLWLDQQISGTGGLSNLGTRAIFSTAQQALPILLSVLTMCLDLGYLSGMMRITRGLYADHTDLKVGLQKFWPLFRLMILQALIYLGLGFLSVQLGGVIFAMTPGAEPAMEAVLALNSADPASLTEAAVLQTLSLLLPMYAISGILFLIILIPFLYKLRFASFCLLDDPSGRALAAIRTSSRLMRRRGFALLKIDLTLWPYYLGTVLSLLVLYSDYILLLLGISLPVDSNVLLLLTAAAASVVQFAVYVTLRNQAEAIYITAYDRLRDKPKEGGPVVLGSIFDM